MTVSERVIGARTADGAATGSVGACEVGGLAPEGVKARYARWQCPLPNMVRWKLGAVEEDGLAV